jgi:hypothetical protein
VEGVRKARSKARRTAMMGMRTPLDRELVGFAEDLCFMWSLFIEGSLAQGVQPAWFLKTMQAYASLRTPSLSPVLGAATREDQADPGLVGVMSMLVYSAVSMKAIGNPYPCLFGRTLWR